MRRYPRVSGEAGFSLIELVIVVAMAAAVLLVFVQGVGQASASFQVRKAANITIAEMRTAQAVSMANGVDMAIEFYTSTGSGTPGGIAVWVRSPTTGIWSFVRSALPPEFPNNVQMPEGVTNFPNCPVAIHATHDCVTFKPLGYSETDGRIRVRSIANSSIKLDIVIDQPATGRVVVEP